MPVDFMGSIAWLPVGFLRVAASCRVPLIAYVASFDELTGRRRLSFYRLENDVRIAMQKLASLLEHAIRTDPAPWHLWANWPQFFDECASS
jgi:lauroyl/myristoyl acyltransferase